MASRSAHLNAGASPTGAPAHVSASAGRHASLHVYETAERGWYCYGRCRRGGTIYDLAEPLYGYDPRGEDFKSLRTELRRLFGIEAT